MLISAADTLNMQYSRLELDMEQVVESVSAATAAIAETNVAVDELSSRISSGTLITSTWSITGGEYYPLNWVDGSVIPDNYCIVGYGFDPFDPPVAVNLSWSISYYDKYTIPFMEQAAVLRCNSELSNSICMDYQSGGLTTYITDDGTLISEDWVCESTANQMRVTIIDDKEYFAP